MKKLFFLLFTLYAMGTSASQSSSVVAQAAQVIAQKPGWLASLISKGSEGVMHAINFVSKDPVNRTIALTAAGAGLIHVVSNICERFKERFYHTNRNAAHSDDMQVALAQLVQATNHYNEAINKVKEFFAFSVPAYISLHMIKTLRDRHFTWSIALTEGLGAGAAILPLMLPFVLTYPIDWAADVLSHIPSPCVINRLRKMRLEKEEAWENVRRIIKAQGYSVDGIARIVLDSRIQLTPTMIDTMKTYAEDANDKVKNAVKKADIWVSAVPQEIQDVIDQAKAPAFFGNIPLPKGVLLLGAPGTGKTYTADFMGKAIGGYFKKYSAGEFFDKYIGQGEKFLRAAYAEARCAAKSTGIPAVIFIDEVEKIVQKRNFEGQQHGYEQAGHSLLDELFVQIDESQQVITVCASNMPHDKFDTAFLRRMDHVITLGLPNEDEAFNLLAHEAEKYPQQMAPFLQDGDLPLRVSARAATLCQLSRDGICKTVVDAVRRAVAREYPVRKRSMQAYEELLRNNPEDRGLQADVQAAASQPILVQSGDIIQALANIREKAGNSALPGAIMQHSQRTPSLGRPRGLSNASPMTVAWKSKVAAAGVLYGLIAPLD
jgi:AAA+ superfamily predicted ATPase